MKSMSKRRLGGSDETRSASPFGMTFRIVVISNERERSMKDIKMKDYYVYIVTNRNNKVMYIGVTNDLERRIAEHKSGTIKGFSQKYKTTELVYYEHYNCIEAAILREKEIKKWRREKKNKLVETMNVEWKDLYIK